VTERIISRWAVKQKPTPAGQGRRLFPFKNAGGCPNEEQFMKPQCFGVVSLGMVIILAVGETTYAAASEDSDVAPTALEREAIVRRATKPGRNLRASEELARLGPLREQEAVALIKCLRADPPGDLLRLIDAGSRGGPKVLEQILTALKEGSIPDEQYLRLAACLGRMGRPAKEAIPILRQKLADPETSGVLKSALRPVLANIGHQDDEQIAQIGKDLDGPYTGVCLSVLLWIRPGAWFDEKLVEMLRKTLQEIIRERKATSERTPLQYTTACDVALVFGLLGSRGRAAQPELDVLLDDALKDANPSAITLAFANACIQMKEEATRDILGRLCSRFKKIKETMALLGPRVIVASLVIGPYSLANKSIAKGLTQLLADPDQDVAEASALLLSACGLSASDVVPDVANLLKTETAPLPRRLLAVKAVSRIASYRQLDILRRLEQEIKEPELKEATKDAIRAIEQGTD
jgi:hypothetical protein